MSMDDWIETRSKRLHLMMQTYSNDLEKETIPRQAQDTTQQVSYCRLLPPLDEKEKKNDK